jgi:hypothetical protein
MTLGNSLAHQYINQLYVWNTDDNTAGWTTRNAL